MVQTVKPQIRFEGDHNFKNLYNKLLEYVSLLCDEVEKKCNNNESRMKLAINLAKSDSAILEELVVLECRRRGWTK